MWGTRFTYRIWVNKPLRKGQLGRSRRTWEGSIKRDLRKNGLWIGGWNWLISLLFDTRIYFSFKTFLKHNDKLMATCSDIQILRFTHSAFMCWYDSQNKHTFSSLNNFNRQVFVVQTQCVLCAVWVDSVGAIYVQIKLKTVKCSKTIEEGWWCVFYCCFAQ
jgi:hypothetical protein